MLETRQEDAAQRKQSIALSARYPRVAVVLGVPPRWHIPLMLCRSLSTISALWWACQMCISLYRVFIQQYGLHEGARLNRFWKSAPSQGNWAIAVAQIGLSFLWVSKAAHRVETKKPPRRPANYNDRQQQQLTLPISSLPPLCRDGFFITRLSPSWFASAACQFSYHLGVCRSFGCRRQRSQNSSSSAGVYWRGSSFPLL